MECLYGFASSVSRDLVCGAINQLRYPCCFNNFVQDLAKEEGNLIASRDIVQDRVAHAKKQTKKPAEVVDKWLKDANIDVDNVNQLIKEARAKKSCCFGHCPNWIWRYHLGKKLANKKKDLEKHIEEGRQYIQFERVATLPSGIPDFVSDKCLNFESRQSAYEQLMEALKDDEVAMIGLYGMGGCGKTTLAMEVRKIAEAEHLFDKVLFVPVSSTVEVGRIQKKIASSIQYTFPETEEKERAQRLYMRLTQENKILVILDDVWEKLNFEAIGIPSSKDHKGCKIFITTRLEGVCTSMDCQRKIHLPILTDEEAWALFQKQAHISEGMSDNLKHLARLISNECKGLPVAIAAVASTLKGKAEVEWKVALDRLTSSKPVNIEKGLQNPYKCLQLSYDNLDTEEAKSLFLLCSVFPEDSEILVEYLTRYAIGLGVVGEVRSYERARNEVIAAKIKLVSSCLLLDDDDDIECVKMHDLVRDVAHWIAKDENKVIECELEKDVALEHNSIRYLWCENFPNGLDCSNLEFLYIKTKLELLGEIFEGMEKLRVLVLVNSGDKRLLPTMSFKTLTNLRCLLLAEWELSDISFIRDIKKLESLSFMDCSLLSFFEVQNDVVVTQLTNLRLLDFFLCDMKRNNFEVIKRIPQLEELYIIDNRPEWDVCNKSTIEFFDKFSVPQALQRYRIQLGSLFDGYDDQKLFFSYHKTLLLSCFHTSNDTIKGLAKKVQVLFIANIQGGAKSIIPDIFQIEGEGMNELNEFQICNSEEIECLVDTSNHLSEVRTLFPKLLTLRIKEMNHLRALWHGRLPPNGPFEKLENLDLNDCPELTSLFNQLDQIIEDTVPSAPVMNYSLVHQDQNRQLDQIIEDEEHQHFLNHHFESNQLKFFPESTSIPSAPLVNRKPGLFTLSSLTRLRVKSCPKLGSLFPASIAKTLTLEELDIEDCHGLKHILNCDRAHSNQKENIAEDDHNFQSDISVFLSLKKLYISGCDLLQNIFPVSIIGGPAKLNAIKNKETSDLKYLFGQNNFEDNSCHQQQKDIQIELPVLEKLRLDLIPNLISSIPYSYQVTCPSLQEISLGIGRYVGFFTINCSTTTSEARHLDYIMIKISNSDSLHLVESGQCLPKQSQGLNLLIMHNIRKIELKGFDKVKYLFNLSTASSMMLEILTIDECPGLEHIIDTGDAYDRKNWDVVFLNLKELRVYDCNQLEYMVGQYPMDNQDYKETHIHFPALERLFLRNVPNFVSVCANNSLSMLCPSLKTFQLDGNSQLINNSIRDLMVSLDSIVPVSTGSKDSGDIQKHFFPLESLCIRNSKVENVFHLNGHHMNGQQVSLRLEIMKLENLPQMTYICMGSKNSFTFQYLKELQIVGCAKLEVIFPVSVLRCLPDLERLEIKECKELKQIIEEDVEDKKLSNLRSPQPCFPKLAALVVQQCHKLKRLISTSASNHLPNLEILIINGAIELEELIGYEQGKGDEIGNPKLELPKLKLLIFMQLSTLQQGTELLIGKHRIVHNCPKLSLSSTATLQELREKFPYEDFKNSELQPWEFDHIFYEIIKSNEVSISGGSKVENANEEDTVDRPIDIKSQSASTSDLPPSQVNDELEKEFIGKVPGSEVLVTTTSTDSELSEIPSPSTMDIRLHKTHSHEWDPTPGNTSQLQMIHEDLTKFENVNDTNQSIMGNLEGMVHEHNQIESGPTVCESYDVLESERESKITQHLQSLDQKMSPISSLNSTESTEDIIKENSQAGPKVEGATIKTLSAGVQGINFGSAVATHTESSGRDILTQDSQIVEQDEKLDEGQTGKMPCQKILDIDGCSQKGSILMDKKDGIGDVSNDCIQIALPSSQVMDNNQSNIAGMVHGSPDSESKRESKRTPHFQPLEQKSSPIPSLNLAESDITCTVKESEGRPINSRDFGAVTNDPMSLFEVVEEDGEGQVTISSVSVVPATAAHHSTKDNLVVKAIADLEDYLKMPLKDIASSQANSLQLLTLLNFLSNLPLEDVAISDGLKAIIDSMHKEFPSILCSFKQAFATTNKLAMLEAQRNEADITLVSKISKAKNFMDEAQRKEAVLKERIIRLEKEIKDCEADLSSLQEEKKKCIEETIGYKKEFENVRKDKCQTVEEQRKARQELFEVGYKWSALCSQFKHNRILARNPS